MSRGMHWIKLYPEMLFDLKLVSLSLAEEMIWVKLILLAGWIGDDGMIKKAVSIPISDEEIEHTFRCTPEEWEKTREKLIKLKLITRFKNGTIKINKWKERQSKRPSDTPEQIRKRVKKHRTVKRQCNGVTPPDVTPLELELELDKEIYKEKDIHPILKEFHKLRTWKVDIADDIKWLNEQILPNWPWATAENAIACINSHSGKRRPPKHKGTWKNCLRNWLKGEWYPKSNHSKERDPWD